MSAHERQGASSVLADIRARRDDVDGGDGLHVRDTGKRGASILCQACGTLLVVTERHGDLAAARALATTNALRNPCCDAWVRGQE